MSNDGGPAFPGTFTQYYRGMTLRDWFAGQALAAFVQSSFADMVNNNAVNIEADKAGVSRPSFLATCAYRQADAMLVARNKEAS